MGNSPATGLSTIRFSVGFISFVLIAVIFSCKERVSDRRFKGSFEEEVIGRFKTISYGRSHLTFSEFLSMGGYQAIEEREMERTTVEFQDGIAQITPGRNHIRVRVKMSIDYDYRKDILPFIEISVTCGEGERFFGFGEWADYADATGLIREIWTQEQHVGGDDGMKPFPFGKVLTYFPVPFFISSQHYAFFVSGYARMEFSMCHNEKVWKVKVFSDDLEFFIFSWKEKPLEAIENFTEIVGRQKTPPIWAFGNWLDEILGQDRVLQTAVWARENGVPSSAIWTEDWAGGVWRTDTIYNIAGWDVEEDKNLYPAMRELSLELKKLGFKFLGYFHHFISPDKKIYPQAVTSDILLKSRDGKIKIYFHPVEMKTTMIDLLNPETQNFMYSIMRRKLELGFSGWMADFAEWVTPDLVSYDGKTGWEFHNLYPYLWAKLNRDFFDKHKKDGDFVFFSRSGYTGSWIFSPVVWQGDQNTSFERFDGIGSIIPSMTSIGIAGVANVGPDIAGYTSLGGTSSKELYIRWTAICAFVPVFRTHHGTSPFLNWRFNKDRETTEIFKFYATEHMRIVPYIYNLSRLAERKGYPAVRHLFLEYPHIVRYLPEKLEVIEQQFLLGENILVVPIVEKGTEIREAFIPPGVWLDYFSNHIEYDGGKEGKFVEMRIPIGKISVLVKKGSCIDVFEPVPHSLVPIDIEIKKRYDLLDIGDVKIKQKCFR